MSLIQNVYFSFLNLARSTSFPTVWDSYILPNFMDTSSISPSLIRVTKSPRQNKPLSFFELKFLYIMWVYLCSSVSISKYFGCCSCFMFETGDKCEIYFLIAHVPLPCQLILVCTLIFFLPSLEFRKSVWNLKFLILFFKIHQSNIIVLFNHFLIPITCTCSRLMSTFTLWD